MSRLSFAASPQQAMAGTRGAPIDTLLLLAPQRALRAGWMERAVRGASWTRLLKAEARQASAGARGSSISTLTGASSPRRVVLGVLPDEVSRHNCPARADFAAAMVAGAGLGSKPAAVVLCLEDAAHALPLSVAVGRALPRFTRAGGKRERDGQVALAAAALDGTPRPLGKAERAVVEQVRWAAELVDTPTCELHTDGFERRVRAAMRGIPGLRLKVLVGKQLLAKGLCGLHAVGRAAVVPPRLLLLEYKPRRARLKVGVIGKGIVYDTGGLSLKVGGSMPGMKADMGGAAAAVGATLALAAAGERVHVVCAAALAENAIGPDAYRNDDILHMHSGKTVEINNTDAEGRLLLADALSYVGRTTRPDLLVDMATLTGAQAVATGSSHAAVVSNREGLEHLARRVGRASGDLAWPLPFAPEIYQDEFRSKVADMKNSVANRMNAQSSCAAQFVYSHIADLDIPWLHVDLAAPAFRGERGTGFGVALTASLLRAVDRDALSE